MYYMRSGVDDLQYRTLLHLYNTYGIQHSQSHRAQELILLYRNIKNIYASQRKKMKILKSNAENKRK